MLTGERFDAAEARDIGLVTHVTSDVVETVDEICAGVLRGAPDAVAATKRLLASVPGVDRTIAFAEMRALSERLFSSPDAAEGMAAFAERRPPRWSPEAN